MKGLETAKDDLSVQSNVNEILSEENPFCVCGHKYLEHYKRLDEILLSFCCVTCCECLQFQSQDEELQNLNRFLNDIKAKSEVKEKWKARKK